MNIFNPQSESMIEEDSQISNFQRKQEKRQSIYSHWDDEEFQLEEESFNNKNENTDSELDEQEDQTIEFEWNQNNYNDNDDIFEQQNRETEKLQKQQQQGILPKTKKEYTIVLDLDNTLIHTAQVMDAKSGKSQVMVYLRPFLYDFLFSIAQIAELVVFTAGTEQYAEYIVKQIDPSRNLISHIVSRNSITHYFNGEKWDFYKDLSILGRDLNKTLLIDDKISNFAKQPQNGIRISAWCFDMEGAMKDCELMKMKQFIQFFINQNMDISKMMNQQQKN